MRTTASAARFFLSSVLIFAIMSAGCSSHEPRSLTGTSWELTSIQSMDDKQGTTAVPDPTKFTVTFGADGNAHFQLDCNRGNGSYQAEPSDDDTSGTLTFGPIAVTMMMCPQPSLDQKVSSALGAVRTYLFKDDQLYLSLMADGGILAWRQVTPSV